MPSSIIYHIIIKQWWLIARAIVILFLVRHAKLFQHDRWWSQNMLANRAEDKKVDTTVTIH